MSFGTDHLSLYQLTIEPATPFFTLHKNGALQIPDEDLAADFIEMTQELTEAAGRPAYEISNHARPGAEAGTIFSTGAMATMPASVPARMGGSISNGERIATQTERLPERWREAVARNGHGLIETSAISRERCGARASADESAPGRRHRSRRLSRALGHGTGRQRMSALIDQGLLRLDGDRLAATPRGRLLLNSVIAALAGP